MTDIEDIFTVPVDGREVKFAIVDDNCPTIRHARIWMWITPVRLRRYLASHRLEKVLMTATSDVQLVAIHSTYPNLNMQFFKMPFDELFVLLNRILEEQTIESEVNWRKEGF